MQRLAMRLVPESKLVDAGVSRPRMLAVLDALKGFDGTESLRPITAPVLLVAGSKDKAGIAAAQELVAAAADRAPARSSTAPGRSSTPSRRASSPTSPTPSSTSPAAGAETPRACCRRFGRWTDSC